MIEIEYNRDIYKPVKNSIGTVMKNPEVIKLVPDHLQTKKRCEHAVKKLHLLMKYFPD